MTEYRRHERLMGSAFELIIVHDNEQLAQLYLEQGITEIKRIETLLTEFRPDSDTVRINEQAALQPIAIDPEVYDLIARCIRLSALTQGAFDITVGALKKLYRFKQGDYSIPHRDIIRTALHLTGYQHIMLLPDYHIRLSKAGVRLSFAAIGKGYAAHCVKQLWLEAGVTDGVINASGDLTVIGHRADGAPWRIGIANPDQSDKMLCYLPIIDGSVATSGDYEQYFMLDGQRYAHTIDPRTGLPLTGIKSVTIIHPHAELCDALATAVYVMGVEAGMHLIHQLPDTHGMIITDDNRYISSKNLIFEDV
jgi:FAD:protein FMN transferase